jgi:hypothetical protein
MNHPAALKASATIELELSSGCVAIPMCHPRFTAYSLPTDIHTFGGKALVEVDGKPQFAELAILRAFERDGWQGRWVETYGHMHNAALWREWSAGGPGAQEHVSIAEPWVNERLQAIVAANGGSYSGCWDVVAWKEDRLVFAEAKLSKKDRIRGTQLRWLEAALKCGCSVEDFLVVEWSLG